VIERQTTVLDGEAAVPNGEPTRADSN